MSPIPGRVLGDRFELSRQVGAGGYAEVWLARDRGEGGKPVAVKVLRPEAAEDEEALARAIREARVLSALEHPHIARAGVAALDGDQPYFTMEWLAGTDLAAELGARAAQGRPFSVRILKRVLGQLCAGVSYAHRAGIIHRDLKPSNVMLVGRAAAPTVKLVDFGIARLELGDGLVRTAHGQRLGSAAYMAPEQIRGEHVDGRADVFAIGVLLFEMLTLRRAFVVGEDGHPAPAYLGPPEPRINAMPRIFERIERGHRPRPSACGLAVGPRVDALIERALAPDRNQRFSSPSQLFEEALEALEPLSAGLIGLEPAAAEALITLAQPPSPAETLARPAETLARPAETLARSPKTLARPPETLARRPERSAPPTESAASSAARVRPPAVRALLGVVALSLFGLFGYVLVRGITSIRG